MKRKEKKGHYLQIFFSFLSFSKIWIYRHHKIGRSKHLVRLLYLLSFLKVDLFARKIEKQDDDYKKYEPFIEAHRKEIEACDIVVAQWGYPHGRLAYHIGKKFDKPYFVQYYGSDIHTNPFRD